MVKTKRIYDVTVTIKGVKSLKHIGEWQHKTRVEAYNAKDAISRGAVYLKGANSKVVKATAKRSTGYHLKSKMFPVLRIKK